MLRTMFWVCVYILTLGIVSIKVKYSDGLRVSLKGWPDMIIDARKKAKKA